MTAIFRNVLTAGFHGSVVILAVLLLRLLLRKAPKKYTCMLWILVGIRLLLPFQLESRLSLQPQPRQIAQLGAELTPAALPPELAGPAQLPQTYQEVPVEQPQTRPSAQQPKPESSTAVQTTATTPAVSREEKASLNWSAALPWVWLSVALGFGVYSIVSYTRLKRRVRLAIKIPGGWECTGIETAFILGFVKPRIYIPAGMSREDRRHILAHERTHLEKGDHWVKLLGFVALAIHWFNPLVWLSYILLCRDIEMACDERVVRFMELEERKRYSSALLHCSANRVHYFACPVAFGEVNVKQRILGVLNYRKPRFWISLLAVAAIIFVAVCLVPGPSEEPLAEEPQPSQTAQGYVAELSEAEVAYTCQQALEGLKTLDSYCIRHEYEVTSTSEYYGEIATVSTLRRAGSDSLITMEEGEAFGSSLIYEGRYAMYTGAQWVWQYETREVDTWLDAYSPAGKTVTFPEGTGVVSGDTLRFAASWSDDGFPQREYTGIFTFTFADDGSLTAFGREYAFETEDGGKVTYTSHLTLQQEETALTRTVIQDIAQQTMTQEEYDRWYRELETITEVPSNKTSYDKDFALGAGSKQWTFFEENNHVRIGAEDFSETGLTLVFSEADDAHAAFAAEEGFWLEKLEDGIWSVVGEFAADREELTVSWAGTDSLRLSWEQPLEGGFYRLGRYYTMTLATGEEETRVCYAKFRLYSDGEAQLMTEARAAWEALFARESYRIYCIEYMTQHPDFTYYMTTEVWKHGADYLMDTRYPNRQDPAFIEMRRGGMWRGGITYDLEWAGDGVRGPLASWNTNTYMDEFNFRIWSTGFEWYDSQVEQIRREGNRIIIRSRYDFNDAYEAEELVMTLDSSGNILGLRRQYLPTRDCAEGEKVVDCELAVLEDSPKQIRATIDAVDLNTVEPFSWETERALLENAEGVRTKNFVNTAPAGFTGAQGAIDRALRDCTLPAQGGMEPGCNLYTAFFDPDSNMWKIECTASWDDDIYQAIYMTDKGVTVMTSTSRPDYSNWEEPLPKWLSAEDGRLMFRGSEGLIDITDRISEEVPFTYVIGGLDEPGFKVYVAVGGVWDGTSGSIGWSWWEREYAPEQGKYEGWQGGGAYNHWNNADDAEYGWYTAAKNEFGTPFSEE